jgi:hypothetical protein
MHWTKFSWENLIGDFLLSKTGMKKNEIINKRKAIISDSTERYMN